MDNSIGCGIKCWIGKLKYWFVNLILGVYLEQIQGN